MIVTRSSGQVSGERLEEDRELLFYPPPTPPIQMMRRDCAPCTPGWESVVRPTPPCSQGCPTLGAQRRHTQACTVGLRPVVQPILHPPPRPTLQAWRPLREIQVSTKSPPEKPSSNLAAGRELSQPESQHDNRPTHVWLEECFSSETISTGFISCDL